MSVLCFPAHRRHRFCYSKFEISGKISEAFHFLNDFYTKIQLKTNLKQNFFRKFYFFSRPFLRLLHKRQSDW
jgi:hypothetical protein